MKTIKPSLLLAVVALWVNFTASAQQPSIPSNSPAGINGKLKVIGNNLCNQYDKPVQLRGMSTHGIQWFYDDCYGNNKLAAFDTLKSWGADILRISMYVQEGGYETNPSGFTNKVKTLIDIATARGMYALVDFHQLDPGDPNFNTANAKTFFTSIANICKNYPNVIYDICNEPNGTTVTWPVIKQYADQVIPVIRAIDDDAVVLCGTHGWATFGYSNGQALNSAGGYKSVVNNKLAYPNVMYTFHFYADSHNDQYLGILDAASSELPVFVTEFGFQNAAGEGVNNKSMSDKYITLMRNKKISWCNWNYSDDSRSGAVWKSGTCSANSWVTANLKEAGTWIRDYIKSPADDFPIDFINVNPTVNITSPTNNAIFNAGSNITLNAAAADADGTVSKVEFFYGSVSIGTSTVSPYSITWNTVPAGTHKLTAVATDNKAAFTTSSVITVVINAVQSPYGGTPRPIPGKIEVEDYDNGGSGVAFTDNTSANEGAVYRTDAVDIETCTDAGAGYNVGYTVAGEWLEYTVNVTATRKYDIELRLSTNVAGKNFHIEMDGVNISGTITVPNTTGWQTWKSVTVPNVSLTAGQKIMRLVFDMGDFNINYINFTSSVLTSTDDMEILHAATIYPNPTSGILHINVSTADLNYEIYNLTGAFIQASTLGEDQEISVAALEQGIYIINLKSPHNSKRFLFVKN